jgi:ribosomal protein S18 acetylase RimI-like enzyme
MAKSLVKAIPGIAAGIAEIAQIKLSVHTRNAPARRLYVSSGFENYAIERNVVRIGEESFDEELMMMTLR